MKATKRRGEKFQEIKQGEESHSNQEDPTMVGSMELSFEE